MDKQQRALELLTESQLKDAILKNAIKESLAAIVEQGEDLIKVMQQNVREREDFRYLDLGDGQDIAILEGNFIFSTYINKKGQEYNIRISRS